MRNISRQDFVDLCMNAEYPVKRIGELPEELRKAVVEQARITANRNHKFLHEMLPFVMNIRGTSGKVELTVLIEKESEIL